MSMSAMKYCKFVFIGLAIILGWWSWDKVTQPWGDQKVTYKPSQKECSSEDQPVPWRSCVHTATQGSNGGLVYILHGRNLDENTWNDDTYYTALIQQYWSQKNIVPPRVVTISFGPEWILTKKNQNPNSGLLDVFINNVMPTVEKKLGVPKYRVVAGESMGGLNSLIVAINTSGFFKRAISLCPGLYNESPYAGISTIMDFLKRTGAEPKTVFGLLSLAKKYGADEIGWSSISPIRQLASVDQSHVPEIYLSCGLYDKMGSFEGSEKFVELARKSGMKVDWHPLFGGHCAIDVKSVAEAMME